MEHYISLLSKKDLLMDPLYAKVNNRENSHNLLSTLPEMMNSDGMATFTPGLAVKFDIKL